MKLEALTFGVVTFGLALAAYHAGMPDEMILWGFPLAAAVTVAGLLAVG